MGNHLYGEYDEAEREIASEMAIDVLEETIKRLEAAIKGAIEIGEGDYPCTSSDIVEDMVAVLWNA